MTMAETDARTPGSEAARNIGCNCPHVDNGWGAGWMDSEGKRQFVIRLDCPIHGETTNKEATEHADSRHD